MVGVWRGGRLGSGLRRRIGLRAVRKRGSGGLAGGGRENILRRRRGGRGERRRGRQGWCCGSDEGK